MTTPEKSVEEIVEEYACKVTDYGYNDEYGYYNNWKDGVMPILQDFRIAIFQAERQKREEAVEAEREKILKSVDIILRSHGVNAPHMQATIFNRAEFMSMLKFGLQALTQPNNQ